MEWKKGQKVISNIGYDVNKYLTIIEVYNRTIRFSDGGTIYIDNIKKGELVLQQNSWRERYEVKNEKS